MHWHGHSHAYTRPGTLGPHVPMEELSTLRRVKARMGDKSMPPIGGIMPRKAFKYGSQMLKSGCANNKRRVLVYRQTFGDGSRRKAFRYRSRMGISGCAIDCGRDSVNTCKNAHAECWRSVFTDSRPCIAFVYNDTLRAGLSESRRESESPHHKAKLGPPGERPRREPEGTS